MTPKHGPQQACFMLCRKVAVEVLGKDNVYDYLPPEKTAYPFFFIGEQYSVDRPNKTAIFPTVTTSVHFYSDNPYKRGSEMLQVLDFTQRMRLQTKAGGYYIDVQSINQQVLTDKTTSTPLLHVVLDVKILCY